MDFHSMKRKELQSLCKKHGIPANLSNMEMANRLTQTFKEMEKPLIQGPIEGHHDNGSRTEPIVERKIKKVRFSPEYELIEFTRSRGKNGRNRRSSVVHRNNALSVGNVDSGELCGKNEECPLRAMRLRRREIVKSNNSKKTSASVVQVLENNEVQMGDVDSRGLRGKTLLVGETRRSKRARKGVKGNNGSDKSTVEDVHFEKLEEVVDIPGRVTRRSKGKKLMIASIVGEEEIGGEKDVKNGHSLDLASGVNASDQLNNRMSLRNRGNDVETHMAMASGVNTKNNGKKRKENLQDEKVTVEIPLRRSKRKAHAVDDSEMANDDTEKPESDRIRGFSKLSKISVLNAERTRSKGKSNSEFEAFIPAVKDTRSRRKSACPAAGTLENNELEAENMRSYLLGPWQVGTTTGLPKDDGVSVPGDIVRRSKRINEQLDDTADNENLQRTEHHSEPCPGENGRNAVHGNTRRSRRNASKHNFPDVSHAVVGDAIIRQNNAGRKQKMVPVAREVSSANSDPSPLKHNGRRSNRNKTAIDATVKNSADRKTSRRLNEANLVDASPRLDQMKAGKSLELDVQAPVADVAEGINCQASDINMDTKNAANDVSLSHGIPMEQILDNSDAGSSGSHALKSIDGVEMEASDDDAASRMTDLYINPDKQITAGKPSVLEKVESLLKYDMEVADKIEASAQMYSPTEDTICHSENDDKLQKGSTAFKNAGSAETSSLADGITLAYHSDSNPELDDKALETGGRIEPATRVFDEIDDVSIQQDQDDLDPDDFDLSEASTENSEKSDEGAQKTEETGDLEPCGNGGQINPVESNSRTVEAEESYVQISVHSASVETTDVESLKSLICKSKKDRVCNLTNELNEKIRPCVAQDDIGVPDEWSIKDSNEKGMAHEFPIMVPSIACADDAAKDLSGMQTDTDRDEQNIQRVYAEADEGGSIDDHRDASDEDRELTLVDGFSRERIAEISPQNAGSFSAEYSKESDEWRASHVSSGTANVPTHALRKEIKFLAESSSLPQEKSWSRLNRMSNFQVEKEVSISDAIVEKLETSGGLMQDEDVLTYSTSIHGEHEIFNQADAIEKDHVPADKFKSPYTQLIAEVNEVREQESWSSGNSMSVFFAKNSTGEVPSHAAENLNIEQDEIEFNHLFEINEVITPNRPAEMSSYGTEISNLTMSTIKISEKSGSQCEKANQEFCEAYSDVEGYNLKLLFTTPTMVQASCKVDETSCSQRKSLNTTTEEKVMTQTISHQREDEIGNESTNTLGLGTPLLGDNEDFDMDKSVEVVNPNTGSAVNAVGYDDCEALKKIWTEDEESKEEDSLVIGNTNLYEEAMDHSHESGEKVTATATASLKESNEVGELRVPTLEINSSLGVKNYVISEGKITEPIEARNDMSDADIEMGKGPEENSSFAALHKDSGTSSQILNDEFGEPLNQETASAYSTENEINVVIDKDILPIASSETSDGDKVIQRDAEYQCNARPWVTGSDNSESSCEIYGEMQTKSEEEMVKSSVSDILHAEASKSPSSNENEIIFDETNRTTLICQSVGNETPAAGNDLRLLFTTPIKIEASCKVNATFSEGESENRREEIVLTQPSSREKGEEAENDISCLGNPFFSMSDDLDMDERVEVVSSNNEAVLTADACDEHKVSPETWAEEEENKDESSLFVGKTNLDKETTNYGHELTENNIDAATGSPKNSNEAGQFHAMLLDIDSKPWDQTYLKSEGEMTESSEGAHGMFNVDIEMDKIPQENRCFTIFHDGSNTSSQTIIDASGKLLNNEVNSVESIHSETNVVINDGELLGSLLKASFGDEVAQGKDTELTMDCEYPYHSIDCESHDISSELQTNNEVEVEKISVGDILKEEAAMLPCNDENEIVCEKASKTDLIFQNGTTPAENRSPFSGSESDSFNGLDWHLSQCENDYKEKIEAESSIFNWEGDNEQDGKNVHLQEKTVDFNEDFLISLAAPASELNDVLEERIAADCMNVDTDSGSSAAFDFDYSCASFPVHVDTHIEGVINNGELLKTDGQDEKPSSEVGCVELDEATLYTEPVSLAKTEDIGFAFDEGLPACVSHKGDYSETANSFASRKSCLSAVNARTILIHGTPRKISKASDMKENARNDKNSVAGDFTTMRPAKRKPLQDVQWK